LLCDHEENMVAVTLLSTISTKTGIALAGGTRLLKDKNGAELKAEIQKTIVSSTNFYRSRADKN